MPFLRVYTNAKLRDDNSSQFVERAAELLAEELGKPISYIVVNLTQNSSMSFAGKSDMKGILAYVESVGFKNKENLIKLLTEFLYERFENVELNNINIETVSLLASDVAIGGRLLG